MQSIFSSPTYRYIAGFASFFLVKSPQPNLTDEKLHPLNLSSVSYRPDAVGGDCWTVVPEPVLVWYHPPRQLVSALVCCSGIPRRILLLHSHQTRDFWWIVPTRRTVAPRSVAVVVDE
jgi:hypothetical protein